jgi:hypothetical protein
MRRAFTDSISDLAWNRDGTVLLAVSLDGTAATVSFTEDEIGRALTPEKVPLLSCCIVTCLVVTSSSCIL